MSEADILAALSTVIDPEIRRPITELDMVGDITLDAGRASVGIKLTILGCPAADRIETDVREAVAAVPGVTATDIRVTIMSRDEREALTAKLRGNRPKTLQFGPDSLTRIFAITSGKGGVGKSTLTANLGVALAARGLRVGIVDADVFGFSIPGILGIAEAKPTQVNDMILPPVAFDVKVISIGMFVADRPDVAPPPGTPVAGALGTGGAGVGAVGVGAPGGGAAGRSAAGVGAVGVGAAGRRAAGVGAPGGGAAGRRAPAKEAVSWRGPMLHRTIQQFLTDVFFGDLDILLLDLPPGTGDVAISLGQLLPQAEVIVVTTPQPAAADVAERSGLVARQTGQKVIGVIENMAGLVQPDGSLLDIFGSGGGADAAARLSTPGEPVPLLASIPISIPLRAGGDSGEPLVLSNPDDPAAAAILSVAAGLAVRGRGLAGRKLGLSVG